MEKQLVDYIYTQLIRHNSEELPCFLRNGKVGIFLFLALYSEVKEDIEARNISSAILRKTLKNEINTQSYGLMEGRLGFLWGIEYLINENILEVSNEVVTLRSIGIRDCMSFHLYAPIQFIKEDHIFSSGVYMAQLSTPENSLERYTHNERLIILLDGCERLLRNSIPHIYSPSEMSLSMLHSILFFLLQTDELGIYPFLTKRLLNYIPELYDKISSKGKRSDHYIYLFLTGKGSSLLQQSDNSQSDIEFLANLGFYSLLYDNPQIFSSAFQISCNNPGFIKQIEMQIQENVLDIHTLCGLGYGLLKMKGSKL